MVVVFIVHDGTTTKKGFFQTLSLTTVPGTFLPTTVFQHFPNLGSKKSQFTTACPFVCSPKLSTLAIALVFPLCFPLFNHF